MDHNWWGMSSTMSSQPQYFSSLFAASPSQLPPYPQNFLTSCHENHDLPSTDSWSQLLLSGFVEEKGKNDCDNLQVKKLDDYGKTGLYPSVDFHVSDARQENTGNLYADSEESQATRSPWSQFLPASSPTSCVTSFRSNILDFSSNREGHQQQSDQSSECNSYDTGAPLKKARIQPSPSAFKVRKEKLGDRITALHQLVSPYGKTDTASVLLEAIGYIRFLQSQIEALSLPFPGSEASNTNRISGGKSSMFAQDPRQEIKEEKPKKNLRSRGLCLVPISFTLQAGNNYRCADYWTPSAIAGSF